MIHSERCAATAMDVAVEVAKMVMESRGGAVPSSVLLEAERIISMEAPLSVQTFIAHERCQRAVNSNCANAQLVEVWTIALRRNCPKEEKALEVLFLKNAVRSHLHFSQLNSWITNNGGKLANGTTCAYRLCLNEATAFDVDGEDLCETHSFPLARCGISSCLLVNVKWRKRDSPPELTPCTPFSEFRCGSDEWLLPSGSMSSSLSSHSFNSPSSGPGTPQFFISLDDDRFKNMRELTFNNDDESADEERHANLCIHNSTPTSCSSADESSPQCGSRRRTSRNKHVHCADANAHLEGPPKKRAPSERELSNASSSGVLDAPHEATSASKRGSRKILMSEKRMLVGQTDVESLADFFATSSISPLEAKPCSLGSRRESLPRRSEIAAAFRLCSAPVTFSKTTGLPLNSSPAPLTRNERSFAERTSHTVQSTTIGDEDSGASDNERVCTARSAPTSSGLLCNFEESALNGRLEPLAALDGFRLQIAASGTFCAPHVTLPVTTFFFNLSDDDAPSPYLGYCSLEQFGRKGYHIPKKGTFQATLFNPQGTVVRVFVVRFDVSEMPPSSQTFLRQRTFFMPSDCPVESAQRSWLRYLIHIRLATDRRGRLYVHTDIRMLFSQKGDLEALNIELEKESQQHYELLSFTEMPQKPRFSPRK